jgi:hypothetical protein
MTTIDLNQLLAVLSVLLAAVVLPATAAVPVLTFVIGLLIPIHIWPRRE